MSTTDDTQIFPADDCDDTTSPNGRVPSGALMTPALRRARGRTADEATRALPPRLLTALLCALSVWST